MPFSWIGRASQASAMTKDFRPGGARAHTTQVRSARLSCEIQACTGSAQDNSRCAEIPYVGALRQLVFLQCKGRPKMTLDAVVHTFVWPGRRQQASIAEIRDRARFPSHSATSTLDPTP